MYLWIVGAVLVLGGLVYSYIGTHPQGVIDGKHEGDVRTTVAAFGNELNSVSVLSPEAADQITQSYGPYVSEELLASWVAEPQLAPGRISSSPWPDHIEVDTVTMNEAGAYDVMGRVMLKTSTGDAGIIPVSLTVSDVGGSFLITRYQENPGSVEPEPETGPAVVTVGMNETASLHGVSVRPVSIEDSRCPMDATCMWAGEAKATIVLVDGMGTSTMPIVLSGEPVTSEIATISLIEVQPYPMASNPTEDAKYRFTFRIEPR